MFGYTSVQRPLDIYDDKGDVWPTGYKMHNPDINNQTVIVELVIKVLTGLNLHAPHHQILPTQTYIFYFLLLESGTFAMKKLKIYLILIVLAVSFGFSDYTIAEEGANTNDVMLENRLKNRKYP